MTTTSVNRTEVLESAKYLVVKVGTNVLTTQDGLLNSVRIRKLVEEICAIRERGVNVVLVSSGAVGAGMGRLGLDKRPRYNPELQAVAAIGQSLLIQNYEEELRKRGVYAAQILLTAKDFANRTRYLNTCHTFYSLFKLGALPIVNENDAVSSAELSLTFGDNDRLASLVATLFPEALLILLTDVDGLYDGDPSDPNSKLISVVNEWTPDLMDMVAEKKSGRSKGGMSSKLKAAQFVTKSGGTLIIANGDDYDILSKIYSGADVGTIFCQGESLSARKRWFQHATPKGSLVVDAGAARAVRDEGKSLLPIGVIRSFGVFQKGDMVEIVDEQNHAIAHGLTNYSNEDAQRLFGKRSTDLSAELGTDREIYEEIVHRNNIQLV